MGGLCNSLDEEQARVHAPSRRPLLKQRPLVNAHQFAIRFSIDETDRTSGGGQTATKVSLYTVEAGRIVREEVFYYTGPVH